MIRPFTIASCLLAFGSGLYLYQEKHEVQLLDRTIERTVHETGAIREQSRLLVAEWTMLTNPERLRKFADTYLNLKTISPTQFSSLSDLDNRLPAPQAEAPAPSDQPELVSATDGIVASATSGNSISPAAGAIAATDADDAASTPAERPAAANEVLPVPPLPAARPAPTVATLAHVPDPHPVDRAPAARLGADGQAHPAATVDVRPPEQRGVLHYAAAVAAHAPDQRPPDQHVPPRVAAPEVRAPDPRPQDQHVSVKEADPRLPAPASPRPNVLAAPRVAPTIPPLKSASMPRPAMIASSAPYSGSLLGMARGSMPVAPRPTPVTATYNAN